MLLDVVWMLEQYLNINIWTFMNMAWILSFCTRCFYDTAMAKFFKMQIALSGILKVLKTVLHSLNDATKWYKSLQFFCSQYWDLCISHNTKQFSNKIKRYVKKRKINIHCVCKFITRILIYLVNNLDPRVWKILCIICDLSKLNNVS